jgi:hypothetical protein
LSSRETRTHELYVAPPAKKAHPRAFRLASPSHKRPRLCRWSWTGGTSEDACATSFVGPSRRPNRHANRLEGVKRRVDSPRAREALVPLTATLDPEWASRNACGQHAA